jgi:hypothetical protein
MVEFIGASSVGRTLGWRRGASTSAIWPGDRRCSRPGAGLRSSRPACRARPSGQRFAHRPRALAIGAAMQSVCALSAGRFGRQRWVRLVEHAADDR